MEIRNLKKNKAPGEDEILNEFIKILNQEKRIELLDLMNDLWKTGKIPNSWRISEIITIHKNGPTSEPGNYRGISLLSNLYKLMANILNKRLRIWCEAEKIFSESQAGFRQLHSTGNNIFILNSLINEKLKRKKGRLFTMFIDIKAAFDSVNRAKLMKKLEDIGLKGRFLRFIANSYKQTICRIKVNGSTSEDFFTSRGVRQGCPLSPLLFNIYIENLDKELERKKEGGTVIGQAKIYCLQYADDIVIVSDDKEGLTSMIKTTSSYIEKLNLEINTQKSKNI